ncbi:MAG: hypothetical protein ACK5H1_03880 [Tenacibaculum sp.]
MNNKDLSNYTSLNDKKPLPKAQQQSFLEKFTVWFRNFLENAE